MAQARIAAQELRRADPGLEIELVPLATSGDRSAGTDRPAEDKSRFVKELEQALLDGEADLAVHSAKDLPAELCPELAIAGVLERADARDALCGARSVAELQPKARVGTSSLRRKAQLRSLRTDIEVCDLRGNLDTRLSKLDGGPYEAILVAYAGLKRLGLARGQPLCPAQMTPAAGQGCLVLEGPAKDTGATRLAQNVTHAGAWRELLAERALTRALEATCHTPVGAHASHVSTGLELAAFVGSTDGSAWIRDRLCQPADANPSQLGERVARRLIAVGASELLAQSQGVAHELGTA